VLALELAGTFFAFLDIVKQLRSYVRKSRQSHEFKDRLRNVLQPMELFEQSMMMSEHSGNELRVKFNSLRPPISLREAATVATLTADFCNNFATVIDSVCLFGDECHKLGSPGFEGFMQQLLSEDPDVHDTIRFFGANYSPKASCLDLSSFPTFVRAHYSKATWGEGEELSHEVAEGRKAVSKAVEVARGIKKQPPFRHVDKRVIRNYQTAVRNLGREERRLKADKQTVKELSRYAPSWFVDLTKIVDGVETAM